MLVEIAITSKSPITIAFTWTKLCTKSTNWPTLSPMSSVTQLCQGQKIILVQSANTEKPFSSKWVSFFREINCDQIFVQKKEQKIRESISFFGGKLFSRKIAKLVTFLWCFCSCITLFYFSKAQTHVLTSILYLFHENLMLLHKFPI